MTAELNHVLCQFQHRQLAVGSCFFNEMATFCTILLLAAVMLCQSDVSGKNEQGQRCRLSGQLQSAWYISCHTATSSRAYRAFCLQVCCARGGPWKHAADRGG